MSHQSAEQWPWQEGTSWGSGGNLVKDYVGNLTGLPDFPPSEPGAPAWSSWAVWLYVS